jgi:hypothetical protein
MKTLFIALLMGLNTSFALTIFEGKDIPITLKHAWYKSSGSWHKNQLIHNVDDLIPTETPKKVDRNIFLSEVWRPSPLKVRNIVFLVAGQQGFKNFTLMHNPNISTGQQKKWHKNPGPATWKKIENKKSYLSTKSMAGQIIHDGLYNQGRQYGFTPQDTYLVVMFSTGFYALLDEEAKQKKVQSITRWLIAYPEQLHKLRNVYLAGSSRGGTLVVRMTRKLRDYGDLNGASIITSAFDAVANVSQQEAAQRFSKMYNPFANEDYYCFESDIYEKVNWNNGPTHILQITSGAKALSPIGLGKLGENWRPFCFAGTIPGHLEHRWVINMSHVDICRDWDEETTVAQLRWLHENVSF